MDLFWPTQHPPVVFFCVFSRLDMRRPPPFPPSSLRDFSLSAIAPPTVFAEGTTWRLDSDFSRVLRPYLPVLEVGSNALKPTFSRRPPPPSRLSSSVGLPLCPFLCQSLVFGRLVWAFSVFPRRPSRVVIPCPPSPESPRLAH